MILDDFKSYLQVKTYGLSHYYRIKPFLTFCARNNIAFDMITYQDIQNYLLELRKKFNEDGTYNNHIFALRQFYHFLVDSGQATQDKSELLLKFKIAKVNYKVKDYITKEELGDMIEMGESFVELIDPIKLRAVCYFLFFTGLRRNEFVNLKRADIDLDNRKVIVRLPTKNKMERVVFLPKKIDSVKVKNRIVRPSVDLIELIKEYYLHEPERFNAFNMSTGQIGRLIKELKDFVPKKNLTIHTFRHSFARYCAKKGLDSRIAQKLLGHKDIHSTMIYYDPDVDVVQEIYNEKVK